MFNIPPEAKDYRLCLLPLTTLFPSPYLASYDSDKARFFLELGLVPCPQAGPHPLASCTPLSFPIAHVSSVLGGVFSLSNLALFQFTWNVVKITSQSPHYSIFTA